MLQASAPELLQLRKTIRKRLLYGKEEKKKKSRQEVTSLLRKNRDAPLHVAELIYCSSVSIFSPAPSTEIKVISLTALLKEITPKYLHYERCFMKGQTGPLSGLHKVGYPQLTLKKILEYKLEMSQEQHVRNFY